MRKSDRPNPEARDSPTYIGVGARGCTSLTTQMRGSSSRIVGTFLAVLSSGNPLQIASGT